MKTKVARHCPTCQGTEFYGIVETVITVLVDGMNEYLGPDDDYIIDTDRITGPYTCKNCGAELLTMEAVSR